MTNPRQFFSRPRPNKILSASGNRSENFRKKYDFMHFERHCAIQND